jgi:hypothetical protein
MKVQREGQSGSCNTKMIFKLPPHFLDNIMSIFSLASVIHFLSSATAVSNRETQGLLFKKPLEKESTSVRPDDFGSLCAQSIH